MTVAILILMNSAQIVTVYDHRLVIIAILLALLVFCAAALATLSSNNAFSPIALS